LVNQLVSNNRNGERTRRYEESGAAIFAFSVVVTMWLALERCMGSETVATETTVHTSPMSDTQATMRTSAMSTFIMIHFRECIFVGFKEHDE
jgi:hypothetical protein